MSEYNFQCACCLKWYSVGDTGPRPTKAELARMVCQSCKAASRDSDAKDAELAALRAENAALKEQIRIFRDALQAYRLLDHQRCHCDDCEGEYAAEACESCFPFADAARLKMRAALGLGEEATDDRR